jgi:putative chitinase
MTSTYRVAATGLNLREEPAPTAEVLVKLPHGHFVVRLDDREWGIGWWRVRAEFKMLAFEGYVAAQHLTPAQPPAETGPNDLLVSRDRLLRLSSNARPQLAQTLPDAFNRHFPRFGITTPRRIRHFLAQAAHESAGFRTLVEYGDEAYFTRMYEANRTLATKLGNTQAGDGARYRGRGIFQLTGRFNYRTFGQRVSVDLENSPELAADPDTSVIIALEYWKQRGLSEFADQDDIVSVTRRINGGLNGLQDRRDYLARAARIWRDTPAVS